MTKLFNKEDWHMLEDRIAETAQEVAEQEGYTTQDVEKAILDYCHDMLCTPKFQLNPEKYIYEELSHKKVVR